MSLTTHTSSRPMVLAIENSASAARQLRDSLSRPSDAYSSEALGGNEALARQRASLMAAIIEPFEVQVTPTPDARTFGPWENRPYRMFVVAKAGPEALLVSADTGLFTLAVFGPSQEIRMTGFASDDALAEWVS